MFGKLTLKPLLVLSFLALCMTLMMETAALAQSMERVDILPRRVILNPRDRGGEFTLLNLGAQESNIRVSIINYRMNVDGAYTELETPLNPLFNPEEVLRLSPRQFTLPQGGRQKVRFSIRKPADLPEGEYRFHIMALRLGEKNTMKALKSGEKNIALIPNIGAAIPIIVRHGNVHAEASLSDLKYQINNNGKAELTMTINRTGNASLIGAAKVIWAPSSGEKAYEIGQSTNLNVFAELDRREAKIYLNNIPEGSGTFHVVYMNEETKTPYAEAKLAK